MSKKKFYIRKFLMFVTIDAFDFGKASPPRIKLVVRHSVNSKLRGDKKRNKMPLPRLVIVKKDAFFTEFVSFGSCVRRRDF